MILRTLKPEDAPLMLEWMHDEDVVGHLGTNFMEKTLEDCQRFIQWANNTDTDLHLAISDDNDTYMGTVSLKHIDRTAKCAEFAITVRACAMGKGYSRFGMEHILEMGIHEMGLDVIYWCVNPVNARAVRFYDKCGYARTEAVPDGLLRLYRDLPADLIWYQYQ